MRFISLSCGRSIILLAAALLSACGGGGSAPVTPPSNPVQQTPLPLLSLTTTTVATQATTTDLSASASVDVKVLDQGTFKVYVGGSYTTNGIDSVVINTYNGVFAFQITFRKPYDMTPGVYTDTLTVRGCLDSGCVTLMPNSPQQITVTYTVTQSTLVPTIALDSSSVDATGFVLDADHAPTSMVNVSFPGMTPAKSTPIVTVSTTTNGIAHADYTAGVAWTGQLRVTMKPGFSAGVGNFTDTVTVRACFDAACTQELAGSPAQVTVHYVVSTEATGNGCTARAVQVHANAMAWDAARQLIYVAIASDAPDHANSIGLLDPLTATFVSYAPVGNNPNCLALSPDGQYLYVGLGGTGEIQRLVLPSMALDLTIPVGTVDGTQFYAAEMHVSPESPHVLGVVRSTGVVGTWGIAIYDDDVMRPNVVSGLVGKEQAISSFQWDSGSRIFGFAGNISTASVIDVDASGAQQTSASQQLETLYDGSVQLLNGRMYTQSGLVYDPLTFTKVGTFLVHTGGGSGWALALDEAQQRAFFLGGPELQSFDLNSLAPIDSTPAIGADPAVFYANMIRWGGDGLALLNDHYPPGSVPGILLVNGTFVHP